MLQFACSPLSTVADFFAYDCNCALRADVPADVATASDAIDMASDIISVISGGRVNGRCLKTVFPFTDGACGPGGSYYGGYDYAYNGMSVIPLRGPVVDVVSVNIDGADLPYASYGQITKDGVEFLIRLDGESWPSNNSFDVTDPLSWTITFRFGRNPDKITRDAVNEIACELAKNHSERSSNLPLGVTNLNLQGVSAQVRDMADALNEGDENFPAVARFLGVYNPDSTREVIGVYSPELSRGWTLYELTGPSGS